MEALESKTYTTEKTLAERMNERLAELHMTKAEAAMRMNYSRSAVSQYLNGKYASDPTEIEKKITEFLIASGDTEGIPEAPDTTEDTGVKLKSKVEFFESRDFINTIGVCQACQENIGLGIIVGKSGQGKTHGKGGKIRGYGTGNQKNSVKLSMLREDFNEMCRVIKSKGYKNFYKYVIPKITVSYADEGASTCTDTLTKVVFSKRSFKAAQGDKSMKVDLDGMAMGGIKINDLDA